MTIYDLTVEIVIRKSYLVEAEALDAARTLALEKAIAEYPGADVWERGERKRERPLLIAHGIPVDESDGCCICESNPCKCVGL